ncbi:acetyltransferase, gnat family protein [Afipia carboxidovorans OM5]|uniref:Putative acetyltransferase n=1 Tax=Afipia carboxidovorans (strain ATCC 49405 / DSM 1227 / KCTC 32145 / OM5) TaxID=504832 RepID=B6JIV5_AFIC5|nr:GNAT family N-acetyltransferase [Afipia carboxidovorans]ACI94349.1 acetyltransferase, gnat family protein [Afipia carboxidovorans OM5]AEI02015.1 putative acetyltransferase [Afipia carboxidovorans OM4]AEI05591.1 putative acetyltransferase [Afipia carboxidovorans OM5]BEV46358.1 GNAT family N-acetyltransferase [Afipia carboxidovorans]
MPLRKARRDEIPRILQLLMDDDLAQSREDTSKGLGPYEAAFDAIAADRNNVLYVWDENGFAVGCVQLTFLPGLSYQGAWLAQAEGVRVDRAMRGQRIGEKMMQAVMGIARERGCRSLQLKSDKRRTAAHRFYERIGMRMSHEALTVDL